MNSIAPSYLHILIEFNKNKINLRFDFTDQIYHQQEYSSRCNATSTMLMEFLFVLCAFVFFWHAEKLCAKLCGPPSALYFSAHFQFAGEILSWVCAVSGWTNLTIFKRHVSCIQLLKTAGDRKSSCNSTVLFFAQSPQYSFLAFDQANSFCTIHTKQGPTTLLSHLKMETWSILIINA